MADEDQRFGRLSATPPPPIPPAPSAYAAGYAYDTGSRRALDDRPTLDFSREAADIVREIIALRDQLGGHNEKSLSFDEQAAKIVARSLGLYRLALREVSRGGKVLINHPRRTYKVNVVD